ncbi:MAG: hypothetical protein JWO08_1026 [Verrucomicrobiaceae bacterium]|nr:hypothetical protein [Verrucomicrobiaceae bacterium]
MISRLCLALLAAIASPSASLAQDRPLPQIEDLYKTDVSLDAITLRDGRTAIYCRQRADAQTRSLKQSLWRVDDQGGARPLEAGEPDAFSPQLSPDGKWIVFLSTRAFADGTAAFDPVPPYSDSAADIWLIPVAGGQAVPLGGKGKLYGRVITDKFYGRVAFSPDGKRLVFVADEGHDPRTEAEKRDNIIVVRDDQGEGYEGYGSTQIWVADLLDKPKGTVAFRITKITADDFWYGDPQWSPDGSFLVVCANRTADQESARYSINHNFDLWKINLANHALTQLTSGPGPEFSPRLSPDGKRLVCLSSPRYKGPHIDVFNLLMVDLKSDGAQEKVLFDHHADAAGVPPHLSPNTPLPDNCWRDNHRVTFNAFRSLATEPQTVDLDAGPQAVEGKPDPLPRSPLLPVANPLIGNRLRAADQVVHWKSTDGWDIEGVVTLPPPSVAKRPYKLLVVPHGGPHHRASGGGGFDTQIFATRGYAVFQPNFRGSTGYGLKFLDGNRNDFGGRDMQDILTGVEHLIKEGIADRDHQFVYGVSYGGFMTNWLVGHTNQFRAAVTQNSVSDLNVMWHLSDIQSWTEHDMSGLPWEIPERMREHSPLTYANKVHTPTLILHSLNDRRCPVAMGRMFYRALKKNGVDTQMVIYPDEGHPIKQLPHREDVLRRILDWFEKHDQ